MEDQTFLVVNLDDNTVELEISAESRERAQLIAETVGYSKGQIFTPEEMQEIYEPLTLI